MRMKLVFPMKKKVVLLVNLKKMGRKKKRIKM